MRLRTSGIVRSEPNFMDSALRHRGVWSMPNFCFPLAPGRVDIGVGLCAPCHLAAEREDEDLYPDGASAAALGATARTATFARIRRAVAPEAMLPPPLLVAGGHAEAEACSAAPQAELQRCADYCWGVEE